MLTEHVPDEGEDMYKPYLDALQYEKERGLYQPKDDRDLLVPLKPLPGIYSGLIWDVIEAGDKAILRLELATDKGTVLHDYSFYTRTRSGNMGFFLHRLLGHFNLLPEGHVTDLKGQQFKHWSIDNNGNIGWRN